MKKYKKAITVLSIIFLFNSCGEDDSSTVTSTVSDINKTIDEYPVNGTTIGTVTTNMTGTLNYSISSQSVTDAFSINSSTGEVLVNDSTIFDFETNSTLGATVTVTNSSETATGLVSVTLNNIDDIAYFLSTSLSDYMAAASGNWVTITEAEYNTLATSLSNVTKSGTTDDQYDYNDSPNEAATSPNGISFANNNNIIIPANSYCFAFKYYIADGLFANFFNIINAKISSTSVTAGYSILGSDLQGIFNFGGNYFVLKGNDTTVTATSYLGIYALHSLGYKVIADPTSYNYTFSNDSNLDTTGSTSSAIILYQGLSTTQKQWD